MATGTDDKETVEDAKVPPPVGEEPSIAPEVTPVRSAMPSETDAGIEPEPHSAADHRQQSLWTASDARGPLEKANDDQVLPAEDEPYAHAEATSAASTSAGDTASPPSPAPVRRSAWPIAAGIVVGALIGAGAALIADGQGLTGHAGGASEAQFAALSAKVDALEQRPAPTGDVAGLAKRVSALSERVDALDKRPAASAQSAASGGADVEALKQSVASLQANLDALKAQTSQANSDHGTDAKVAALTSELAGLKSTTSQNLASLASVKDDQKRLSDKVTAPAFAAAADSLLRQVDQGESYRPQLDALTSLGADPAKLAILRQNADRGVPSAKVLAQKFEPLAEPISASTQKVPPNAGFVDRLKSGMLNMVSIRSVDDTSGSDLPSRVARIKLDLAHDDVADAVATWDALPAEAKSKGDAWAALARSRAEAIAAARALQQDAIVALSAKKS